MFDFTPVSQGVAALVLVYLVAWPLLAVVTAIAEGGFDQQWPASVADWLQWPFPILFSIGTLVLIVDFSAGLRSARLTTTQVTGYRVAAALMLLGALSSLQAWHWFVFAFCAAVMLVMLMPWRRKAQPSTWTL